MKQNYIKVFYTWPLLVMTMLSQSIADQNSSSIIYDNTTRNETMLKKLRLGNVEERNSALIEINRGMKKQPLTKEIVEQILLLAEKEHKDQEYASKGELGEQYHTQLITALGNTRDPKAVSYLMENLGGGTAVLRSLHKIGEPAIDPLIKKLNDDVVGIRSSAAYALGLYLNSGEGYIAKGEAREKIKQALISAFQDSRNKEPEKNIELYEIRAKERANVRSNILKGLGHLAKTGDVSVIPLIKSTAEEDPYVIDKSKKTKFKFPEKRYMIREEAKKILDELDAK